MLKTAALAALALSAGAVLAQPPDPARAHRGARQGHRDDRRLAHREARQGAAGVGLTPTWTVAVMKPVAIDAIQPGSFIGTSEMPNKDGTSGKSLEVHVFPPGVKMGEGHYGWDLKPGSMMTNGTVGKVVAGKKGSRELDVSLLLRQAPHHRARQRAGRADRPRQPASMVKVGTPVFMVVQKTRQRPDGGLGLGRRERRQAADVTRQPCESGRRDRTPPRPRRRLPAAEPPAGRAGVLLAWLGSRRAGSCASRAARWSSPSSWSAGSWR